MKIRKIFFLLIIGMLSVCNLHAIYYNGTEWLSSLPSDEEVTPDGENSGSSGSSTSSEESERARKIALKDELKRLRKKVKDPEIVEEIKKEIKKLEKEISELDEIIAAKKAEESKNNKDERSDENGKNDGDPVKITKGSYEQYESDFSVGNTIILSVNRNYTSSGKITSDFGFGWTSNIDQRIILGIEPDAEANYQKKLEDNRSFEEAIKDFKAKLLKAYEIKKLNTEDLDDRIVKAEYIERELDRIGERGYAASDVKELKALKKALEDDIAEIKRCEEELEKKKAEAEEYYKDKVIPSIKRHNKNRYVLFAGSPSYYENTGLETITVIDENGYPHLMNQNPVKNNEWKEENEKEIIRCISANGGYLLYESSGIIKEFDSNGFIIRITDRNKNEIRFKRSSNGQVNFIESTDGEKLTFEYSGKYISRITNERSPDESAFYTYSGKRLVSVTDADGDMVKMEYDSDGRLTALIKCDGSRVCFTYGEQDSLGNVLATETISEEGYSEYFRYYRTDRRTDYIDHDGNTSSYWYDENQRTLKEIRPDGSLIQNEYDEDGNLISVNENGSLVRYAYDDKGNKTSAHCGDGSSEYWTYDKFNQINSYTDRDGVSVEYVRDEKGNVKKYLSGGKTVYELEYNGKGQVIKQTVHSQKDIVTDYEYDDFGNLKSQNCGGVKTEYEYDGRNRIEKIKIAGRTITEYVYDGRNTIKKDYNGLETTYLTNGRKDLVQVNQKDIVTGDLHQTRIDYDRRHLPLRIYEGDGESEILTSAYLYTPEGKIKALVNCGQESWITIYDYKYGEISEVKQFKSSADLEFFESNLTEEKIKQLLLQAGDNVYSQKYDRKIQSGNKKLLKVTDSLGIQTLFEYDSYGNLVKTSDGNRGVTQSDYTKGGRLKGEQNSYGGWYEYLYENGRMVGAGEKNGVAAKVEYYPDGSIKSTKDRYGKSTSYNYDSRGRVSGIQNEAQKVWYEYDTFDRVTKQIIGNTPDEYNSVYYVTYDYSLDGRSVAVTEGGKYKTVNTLDAFGNVVNTNERSFVYNCQNQLKESYDGYGNKTSYEYNSIGAVSRVVQADGASVNYEYNYMGLLEKVRDDCGLLYKATYDKTGRLVTEWQRADSEKTYKYDDGGRIKEIWCGGELTESYTYGEKSRTVTVKDGEENNYLYNYDAFGKLTSEINRNGLEEKYFYDPEGQLEKQQGFDGSVTKVNYSNDRTIRTVKYSDGSENRFVYDAAGNLIEAENAYGKSLYRYDQGGRLVYQKDVTTGEEITFEYDACGNRTKLLSTNRETKYTYGKNNEVKEIFDNKQRISIKLSYDKNGREVLRKFGNGTEEETLYDRGGRVTAKMQKDSRGELLWGEGYVYASDGKRSATVDKDCRVTLYEYNKKGQLETVYYPYTKELETNLKKEAEANGLAALSDVGENRFLTSSEKSNLVTILNSMQYGLAYNLPNLQVFIKESYTYDANGNRSSKTSPYGKIEYTYDRENCLLSSGSHGQAFVTYTYDKAGNLLTEESPSKVVKYAYNAQNRLIYSEVTDRAEKEYSQTSYAYDALGRRILVQDKGEAALRPLYDGLTFDVIKQSPVFANGLFTDSQDTGIKYGRTGKPTGDRYRYLDDDSTKDGNRYIYLDDGTYRSSSTRYYGERTAVSLNGTIAAQSTSDGTDYFVTDLQGSVTSLTDSHGSQDSTYTYDAFGTLVQGDLTGSTDYGYLGKQLDPSTSLYNYGYRDYKPEAARFTTSDPIRDGANWFAYCNGDPVNFVDLWGLEASDSKNVIMGKDYYNIDFILKNVPVQYQKIAINALIMEEKNGRYGSPTDSKRITEGIGSKTPLQEIHTGADIGALKKNKKGDPIYATADGVVLRAGKTSNSGSTRVELSLPYTKDTAVYQHADFIVKKGDKVKRGQIIGYMSDNGTPGNVHLHYEIRKDGVYAGNDITKVEDPTKHMPSSYRKE